ncbi:MAG: hypothetical protein IJG61_00505 [Lachnospiraceae bacterium]|nr:hypothetical protein [Lachnospiraceae bacterium]
MDELFGNGNEMNEDALPVNAEAEDLFEDDAVSEIMKDTDRLSALEESYIAEVEERAAGILANAEAEARRSTDALKEEVFREIAAMKTEAEEYCREKEAQAERLFREAEDAANTAQTRLKEAEDALSAAKAEAEAEAARIRAEAEADAVETKAKAEKILREAQETREMAVVEHERLASDGKQYIDVMEDHALARLNMISELLRSEQDWAFRAKQNVDELSAAIAKIREQYDEDYRY